MAGIGMDFDPLNGARFSFSLHPHLFSALLVPVAWLAKPKLNFCATLGTMQARACMHRSVWGNNNLASFKKPIPVVIVGSGVIMRRHGIVLHTL